MNSFYLKEPIPCELDADRIAELTDSGAETAHYLVEGLRSLVDGTVGRALVYLTTGHVIVRALQPENRDGSGRSTPTANLLKWKRSGEKGSGNGNITDMAPPAWEVTTREGELLLADATRITLKELLANHLGVRVTGRRIGGGEERYLNDLHLLDFPADKSA
jgi:hypothetical protein